MSDTERSTQADDDTVVRKTDDAKPGGAKGDSAKADGVKAGDAKPGVKAGDANLGTVKAESKNTGDPVSRPRLADRLMGRTSGPKPEAPAPAAEPKGPEASNAKPEENVSTSAAVKPKAAASDIQPTGSAASAVPAPPGTKRSGGGSGATQAEGQTVLSAGPVVGTGRPDFAAGVPTTVSTAPAENSQVGVLEPDDPAMKDVAAKTHEDPESRPNRETLTKGRPTTRRTRKARLRLASVDPWSVMKMAFLFSMAAGIALVVAVMVIWFVIGQSGLFDAVNQAVNDALSAPGDQNAFDLSRFVSGGRVIGSAIVLAVIDVLLLTALATVGAFLYNLGATLLGGFEVTLADD